MLRPGMLAVLLHSQIGSSRLEQSAEHPAKQLKFWAASPTAAEDSSSSHWESYAVCLQMNQSLPTLGQSLQAKPQAISRLGNLRSKDCSWISDLHGQTTRPMTIPLLNTITFAEFGLQKLFVGIDASSSLRASKTSVRTTPVPRW